MKDKKFKLSANLINEYRSFIFLALILIIGLFVERFYSAYNISAATGNGTLVIWLGLGFTVCMIAGHMDLTIMYMSTLGSSSYFGITCTAGSAMGSCNFIATLVGVLVGLINGLLVTQLKLPAFIATLGMQFVLKGTMYIYTGGEELSIGRDYDFS